MINKECEIVKDLIPNYMENEVSSSTKDFIEEHIKNCNACKNLIEELKKEKIKEKNNEKIEETLKIDYLKKYNEKIKLLKTTAILIILVILFIWIYIFEKNLYIKNHYEYTHNIISAVYERTKDLKEKNFSVVTTYSDGSKMEFYYKDGKYKECYTDNYIDDDGISGYINYGVEKEERISYVLQFHRNGDKILGIGSPMRISSSEGEIIETSPLRKVFFLNDFYKMGKRESLSLEIREDRYNEKECIVVRYKINNSEYEEMWIDKEEMLVIKDINNELDNIWQCNYTWQVGNVTDEDVSIKNQKIDQVETQQDKMYDEVLDLLQN